MGRLLIAGLVLAGGVSVLANIIEQALPSFDLNRAGYAGISIILLALALDRTKS